MSKKNNVLAISDLHIPFSHPDALAFCFDTYRNYKCNQVIFMGDTFDVYSLSKYTKSPEGYNVTDEFKLAKEQAAKWARAFPEATCLIGNHEDRINKRLTEVGIPRAFIKSFNTIFGLPETWIWKQEFVVDDVHYLHGDRGGLYAHTNIARDMRQSVVTGHTHTSAGTHFLSNYDTTIFALNVGCLIDQETYAFAYTATQQRRAVLGTGLVLDGLPMFVPLK